MTQWGNIYEHIARLPSPFRLVADEAFDTHDILKDKLVKSKQQRQECHQTSVDSVKVLSQKKLRQAPEWGKTFLPVLVDVSMTSSQQTTLLV